MLIKKERFKHYMKDSIDYETFKRFVERPPITTASMKKMTATKRGFRLLIIL